MNTAFTKSLQALRDEEFVRQRWLPRPGDEHYLALSDLRLVLNQVATSEPLRILDFGAGGSPYRALFPNAFYVRADFQGDMDLIFKPDGSVPAESETFDLILSTQVLEHCAAPDKYIGECRRLLRSGGRVILSTHGLFEEHACPHDYHRWTQGGLEKLFVEEGFEITKSFRLTAGPRGGVFLFDRSLRGVKSVNAPRLGNLLWRGFRRLWFCTQRWRDQLMDRWFGNLRVTEDGSLRGAHTYIGLAVVARKL